MARVVVTRALPGDGIGRLRSVAELSGNLEDRPIGRDGLLAALPGADAVLALLTDRIDEEALDAAGPSLRIVADVAVGYDNVDVEAACARGVVVTNTPDVLTESTADLAVALMLAAARRVGEGERLVRSGAAWDWGPSFMLGRDVHGAALGIIGMGRIGRAVARRAVGFGMTVRFTSRSPLPETGFEQVSLDALLARSDIVSLHCPLTPETHHLIGARELGLMRPHAILVNTARGPVVDEEALAVALSEGTIGAAGLDVYEREPKVHPGLLALENLVLLPHLGSATVQTRTAMVDLAVDNVLAVLAGRPPLTPVR